MDPERALRYRFDVTLERFRNKKKSYPLTRGGPSRELHSESSKLLLYAIKIKFEKQNVLLTINIFIAERSYDANKT